MHMVRTVGPRVLFARQLVEEEPARGLEGEVAGDGGNAFELLRDRVQNASVERRAFCDIVRVGRQDGVNLTV